MRHGIYTALLVIAMSHAFATAQVASASQTPTSSALNAKQRFESAMAAYQGGRFSAALNTLQPLLRSNPDNPDANELAGLVLAAVGQNDSANSYLAKAVRLRPQVSAWRTAYAVNLLKLHRNSDAELQFREIVEMNPDDYDSNHNLGEFYIQTGQLKQAIPYLRRAQDIRPSDYNNGYDLALACEQTGELDRAQREVEALLKLADKAELHSLLGEIEEKDKNYIAAAREYEQAAHMDPSEANIFAWGAELLVHQTFEPAIAVFQAGIKRFPESARLQLGLGIALYGSGQFDDGARKFCEVWDHNYSDPLPLTFAGRAYGNLSATMADQVRSRLARFLQNGGANASVSYYYAIALWKEHQQHPEAVSVSEVESHLQNAIRLQPSYADAHLQLGIINADEHNYTDAVAQYQMAVTIAPNVAATHYRLGQAFARMGDKMRAQQEFAKFEQLHNQEVVDTQKQDADIQQFVYTMRNAPASTLNPN